MYPSTRSFGPGIACALALFLHGGLATAESLAECTRINSSTERLACFDRVAGTPQAVKAAPAGAPPVQRSLIDDAWGFDPGVNKYLLRYFRQNYILAARYTDDVNQEPFSPLFDAAASDEKLKDTEARFQLSFKSRVWATDDRRMGVWVAYTQQSQWQVFSGDISRPFRETNYKPEIFMSYRPNVQLGAYNWRLFNFGYIHQSNGRSQILSRSWDRIFAEFGIERDDFAVLARTWYRIPESANEDDNPDINRYMGYGDLTALYKWGDHSIAVMGRGNWNTSKGAIRLSWTTPPLLGPLRGYLQVFSGYGDSMIDYNWNQNIVGIGITLNDVL